MRTCSFLSLAALCCAVAPNARALQRAPEACDVYESAVRASPNDLEAAARLGRCSVRDYEIVAVGKDSSRLEFRSSWSVALRALRHAIAVDPTFDRAYRPFFSILLAENRDGCSTATGLCEFVAPVRRDGDSVITPLRRVRLNVPGEDTYDDVTRETRATRAASLAEARVIAERWVSVAPTDRRPHEYLGRVLLLLGEPSNASAELEHAAELGTVESKRALFWPRFEALVRANQGGSARRLLDAMVQDRGRDTTRLRGVTIASLNALAGRFRMSAADVSWRRSASAPHVRDAHMLPNVPDGGRIATLLAAGDTAAAIRALARMDSAIAPTRPRRFPAVGAANLASAQLHLAVGDTSRAEAQLDLIEREWSDPFEYNSAVLVGQADPWWGDAWSLAGDLAAARGRREQAVLMYRRVEGLWSGADPEVAPLVERARARLAALGGR